MPAYKKFPAKDNGGCPVRSKHIPKQAGVGGGSVPMTVPKVIPTSK